MKRFSEHFWANSTLYAALLGVVLLVAGYVYIVIVADEYEYHQQTRKQGEIIAEFWDGEGEESMTILGTEYVNGEAVVRLRSKDVPGKAYLRLRFSDDTEGSDGSISVLYVHKNGVITEDDYFGQCTGMLTIRVVLCCYLAVLLFICIGKLRRSMKQNLYQYRNILYYGVILFLAAVLLLQILQVKANTGAIGVVTAMLNAARWLTLFSFPVILITAVFVTVSNIQLIRKEGKTWHNILAFMLGVLLSVMALMPEFIETFLQYSNVMDVHKWSGIGRFIELFLESSCSILTAYLECILIGTIIVSVKAARRLPAKDKDFIIILGSMIRKDGTLTKLLQSRADRAVEFGRMQEAAGGKKIVYIPSGGQGADEVIAEGTAIGNYLRSQGIPDEQLLIEDRSVNTEENMKFSAGLIRERNPEARVAFATTNYHVFRAGLLATAVGLKAEGIGSRTRWYFWINAFVREFIATLYAERKRHLFLMLGLFLVCVAMVVMLYVSNVVLS